MRSFSNLKSKGFTIYGLLQPQPPGFKHRRDCGLRLLIHKLCSFPVAYLYLVRLISSNNPADIIIAFKFTYKQFELPLLIDKTQ